MKCLLSVCLSVLSGVAIFAANQSVQTPALQKGVSVQMAPSAHAATMPEADEENAWVVTVATNGGIYFGANLVTAEGLAEEMKAHPRNRDAKLYVKADAAAPFNLVRQVLRAARLNLFDSVVLLTSQPEASQPGAIIPPKGLYLWIGNETGSNLATVRVESEDGRSNLQINNKNVPLPAFQATLAKLFDNQANRIAILKASGQAPFADVIHVIDACRAAGASRISMPVSTEI